MRQKHLIWPPGEKEPTKFRGQWIALEDCRYDHSHQPVEGNVVDSDEDLAELCARLHECSRGKCLIMYCDEDLQVSAPRSCSESRPMFAS